MADIDLNLLTALDALLAEGSVAGAARRLGLSASAMRRTLARLRAATGDALLVRAGRGMVPTPHAADLRERVRDLTQDARGVLRPAVAPLDLTLDEALAELGLKRTVIAVVPSFRTALSVAGASNLVALVTASFFNGTQRNSRECAAAAVRSFPLPVRTATITVSQMWHPRLDTDPAHRWLRGLLRATCRGNRS
jgi:DNA-binding transcriptional LysR family regulator